ncbi:MAG: hypothetical protein IT452_13225 [Planctomycetia bacterium]|nr:hypothetical protein [Planctomycetia bacterium]
MRLTAALLALSFCTLPALAEDAKPADKEKKEAKKEKEKLFSPEFDEAPLSDLLTWLTREAGFEYDLTKAAQKLSKSGLEKIKVVAKDKTAREILDMALAQLGLSWAEKVPGQIKIMSSEEYVKDAVLELYDVRELLNPITDFAGPEGGFKKKPANDKSAVGEVPSGHKFEEPPPEEREKERPKKPIEDPEKLKQLLRDGSGGDEAWGEGTSMDLVNGILYVKAPWKLQNKVRTLLNQFRQFK